MGEFIKELLNTRGTSTDLANRQSASREFIAEGFLPDAVPALPDFEEIKAWTGPGSMFYDKHDIVAHPDGKSSRIVSWFSNTKHFRLPAKVDDADPTFQSLSISFDKVRHEIPHAQYEADKIKIYDKDGQATIKAAWVPGSRQVPAAHIILQRRVVLTGFPLELAVQIQAQVDHVHKLPVEPGLWGRFSAGDITEAEPGRWVCVYTWDCDPGHILTFGAFTYPGKDHTGIIASEPSDLNSPPGLQGVIAVPTQFVGALDDAIAPIYTRPPFCEMVMVLDFADEADGTPRAPSFDYIFDGVLDPNGWASLPGDPF